LFDISSPYLLVFGDDRVRGTREQMHKAGAGLAWEIFYRGFVYYVFYRLIIFGL